MFKPVIKWSGSKRTQAHEIIKYLPTNFDTYYEPFIGGGSMLYAINPDRGVCGDVCIPLINLWKSIQSSPKELAEQYRVRWERLQKEGYMVYYEVRDNFNKTHAPVDLLFLSRTCVNGLIRFNANGDFNNSLHHTRPGIEPSKLSDIILDWSSKIQNAEFIAQDYTLTTANANKNDIVYLDPPYFHTKGRYFGTIDFNRFLEYLDDLNRRGVKYMLSFDGIRGQEDYTVDLPKELYKRHIFIESGNSTFRKVIDKETEKVLESLYLNY